MDIREELKSAGVYPTGPCSAWPEERNEALLGKTSKPHQSQLSADTKRVSIKGGQKVNATTGDMAKGLLKTAGQALRHGRVSAEVREERYDTCKACPFFLKDSKRCSDCGCFMEAKTWVGGDPDVLCPQKKWSR